MKNRTKHTDEYPIKVYLTTEERMKLEKLAIASGHSKSSYMRQLLGFVIPRGLPPPDYQTMIWHLNKIGSNLNQIAKTANMGGGIPQEDYRENYQRLRALVLEIKRAVTEPGRLTNGSNEDMESKR